jgi:cytochrome bd-type quinol oxidase subunit 2
MDLPLISAVFAAFSITIYVLLDGFDLGVGALLLLQPHEASRDHMVDSITPTWDGNETWLIMTGVTLLAGFPVAYSILMPAFYVPLVIMLLALGLRGVSFEFRSDEAVSQVVGCHLQYRVSCYYPNARTDPWRFTSGSRDPWRYLRW